MAILIIETQAYKVIQVEQQFEIRYYSAALKAKIASTSTSYCELGYTEFVKLSTYIFGGNNEHKQIAMTSPVHIDIGISSSSVAFVMPTSFTPHDLPKPNNSDITFET
jgi:hypothetical protein